MRTSISLLERRDFAAKKPGPRAGYELATHWLSDLAPKPGFSGIFCHLTPVLEVFSVRLAPREFDTNSLQMLKLAAASGSDRVSQKH
jgi:hypothetical protein